MKIKYLISILILLLLLSCGSIEPVSKKYQDASIEKICIFADFESREIRKHLERKIAQMFKGSSAEAFESYVLIPKTMPFTNREMKKKLEELNIDHYLYLTRLNEGAGISITEEPFIEFGQLKGNDGPITSRPQISVKLVSASGELIWSSSVEIEVDAEREFPINENEYMEQLKTELTKANLIEFFTAKSKD